jgi:heptosyltransferase-2/heptosyltransferase-3
VVSDLPATAAVLRGLPCVGAVEVFAERRLPYLLSRQQWSLRRWLQQRRGSPVYLVEERRHPVPPWGRDTAAERLVARAGFPAGEVVTLAQCPREPLEHALTHLWRLGAMDPSALPAPRPAAPAEATEWAPQLMVTDEERADARDWLLASGWDGGPLILLQTQARRDHRGLWPPSHWRALALELLALRPDALLLLAGSAAEQRQVAALAQACAHPRVRSAAGELPLRRLFAVLAMAHSAISLDTGPAHVAAALDCPLVVLAGRADPRRHRPWGPAERVQVVTATFAPGALPPDPQAWYERHEMTAIDVASVLAAWQRLGARQAPVMPHREPARLVEPR